MRVLILKSSTVILKLDPSFWVGVFLKNREMGRGEQRGRRLNKRHREEEGVITNKLIIESIYYVKVPAALTLKSLNPSFYFIAGMP